MTAPQDIRLRAMKLRKSIDRYRYDFHVLNKETISPAALDLRPSFQR